MSLTTFKIGKREFVIVPRRRYQQLTRAELDQKDGAIARKGRETYLRKKSSAISHVDLKRKLGIR